MSPPSLRALLPRRLRAYLERREYLHTVIDNSGWLFLDKFIRMGLGLIVGILIARYLGPERFGLLNYAIAFVTLFGAIASFGIDDLTIRNLITSPQKEAAILGTGLLLKLCGSIITVLLSLGFTRYAHVDHNVSVLVLILSFGYLCQSFSVIDSFFKALQAYRYTVSASIGAFLLTSLFRLYLIHANAPVVAFVVMNVFESALTAGLLYLAYRAYTHRPFRWTIDVRLLRATTRQCLPLIFALVANSLYMRIDQVMIGTILGQKAVGLYSASVRISESWFVILTIVSTVCFPLIVKAKAVSETHYYRVISKVLSINIAICCVFILPLNVLRHQITVLLFGPTFGAAATSLAILSWAGLAYAFGSIWGYWIIIENMQKWSMISISLAAILNVLLNLLLIPRYGINGSAVATVTANVAGLAIIGAFEPKILKMNRLFLGSLSPMNVFRVVTMFKTRPEDRLPLH